MRAITLLALYHLIASGWRLLVAYEAERNIATWLAPVFWVNPERAPEFLSLSRDHQHLLSFYYTEIAMLNVGETGPRSVSTLLAAGAAMVMGALVNAHLFGLMIAYVQAFSRRERMLLSKMLLA